MDLVSVVILCWNRKNDVEESLLKLRNQTYSAIEIVVVDNGSTDGTQEMIEEAFPDVVYIRMEENIGIEAYNVGFKRAQGVYIVILDDDSFPADEAIERMVEKFNNDDALAIVAFDVRNFYSYDKSSVANFQEMQIKQDVEKRGKNDNIPIGIKQGKNSAAVDRYLMSFNGAGAGVRKEVLAQCGYYPGEFFLYWNEMDLAFRVLDYNYKIEFFSDVVSYHKFSVQNRTSWRAPFYYTRNAFWLIWKNYSAKKVFVETYKLIYSVFYFSLEQKTFIYMKAMINAFANINSIKDKRKPVQKKVEEGLRVPFNTSFTFFK